MKRQIFLLIFAISAVVMFVGCKTPITITTEPAGAVIWTKGAGRSAYQWSYKGTTDKGPVTFDAAYSAIRTVAVWKDADGKTTAKKEVYTKLSTTKPAAIHIQK